MSPGVIGTSWLQTPTATTSGSRFRWHGPNAGQPAAEADRGRHPGSSSFTFLQGPRSHECFALSLPEAADQFAAHSLRSLLESVGAVVEVETAEPGATADRAGGK